ncbi:Two-component response regulator ARR17 [Linum grandiflorum]
MCSYQRQGGKTMDVGRRGVVPGGNSTSDNPESSSAIHVLAVDDNLVERKLLERLLKNVSSCTVTMAENGAKALEYLGLQHQDHDVVTKVNLIITDYCMPEMTGYELLKKIKESRDLKGVPVVVVSSENIPTRVNQCLKEGAEMFMVKPLKQSDVNKLVMTPRLMTNQC